MHPLTLNFNAELEHALQQIAEKEGKNLPEIIIVAVQQFIQQYHATYNDPWANPDLELPSVDTGITDFARNHDYHLNIMK